MTAMLAVAVFTGTDVLNIGFLRFCTNSCRSGYDNIVDGRYKVAAHITAGTKLK